MYESRFISRPDFERLPHFPIAVGHIIDETKHYVQGTRYPEHMYNYHFIVKGSGWIRIGTETVSLKPGMGFLCSENHAQHFGTYSDDAWEVWWVIFSGEGMRPLLGDKCMGEPWVFAWTDNNNILPVVMDMWKLAGIKKAASSPKLAALLYEVTLELLLHASDLHAPKGWVLKEQIRRTAEFIRNKRNKKLTLSEMAGFCGISPHYFSRTFHAQMGMPPLEYLAFQRVELAKQLLISTAKPIKQVAIEVGFSQVSYFIERFRLSEGVTPVKYREKFMV
jgi:AraC-like DNA-binding protein